MFTGAHVLLYSNDPAADRVFFRDVLELRAVDAGEGWLIFALPPAEAALHPAAGGSGQLHAGHHLLGAVLYLMCTDLRAVVERLEAKNVRCTEIAEEAWGVRTTLPLPSGGALGLYQPAHPTALDLGPGSPAA